MEHSHLATRVKEYRTRKGMSQEALAEEAGLSHRTVQRIENGESKPTGDTLQRLAAPLGLNPDELINWKIKEDNGFLVFLNLATLSFLVFPILGILVPFTMWTNKKGKLKDVQKVGAELINFEITWVLSLVLLPLSLFLIGKAGLIPSLTFRAVFIAVIAMYILNIGLIAVNTFRILNKKDIWYYSPIKFLR
ncbi:MAG: helix-turn-helix domain-containing protein [Imperialibacter sp.]|uniref:helix-turn-helix domain-containing protein n=1 Tax=Imperialibacter sp. TaxID=2038411 RepID=UPI0032EE5345